MKLTDAIERLAKQALCVMVLDLEYDNDLRPGYGHAPLRHQLLWDWCREALGNKFDAQVQGLVDSRQDEKPVKSSPWKTGMKTVFGSLEIVDGKWQVAE